MAITGFPDHDEGILHVAQDQAYVFAVGRLLAAALLVFGGVSSLRGRRPRYPGPMLLAPAIVVVAVIAVVEMLTATVAILSWGRYQEHRDPLDHAAAAAFLVLAIVNGAAVVVAITGFPDNDEGILHVGQDQAYVFAVGRVLAAALLVFGGISSLRGRRPRYPGPMLAGAGDHRHRGHRGPGDGRRPAAPARHGHARRGCGNDR